LTKEFVQAFVIHKSKNMSYIHSFELPICYSHETLDTAGLNIRHNS